MRQIKQAFVLMAAAATVASCTDELNLDAGSQTQLEEVYFTASIAEQDFFGTNRVTTRSVDEDRQRVEAGFYDLPIDGRDDIHLSVATLDGMFGKPAVLPVEGQEMCPTRGAMIDRLGDHGMSIFEVIRTTTDKVFVGETYEAYTVDGSTWGGSFVPRNYQSGKASSRTIYAFYPREANNHYNIDRETKSLVFSGAESAYNLPDVLFAQTQQTLGLEDKDSLHLTFNHLLTAVRFKVGSQQLPMSVIRKITISGIYRYGEYFFEKHEWKYAKVKESVSCDLKFNVTGVENTIINGGENTFMLIPQQLTPDAKVTIEYEDFTEGDSSTEGRKTLTASLATALTPAWEAGQCVTYTLMTRSEKNEYILDVEAPEDFPSQGGAQTINVLSYYQNGGVRTPMRWIVQNYSADGGKTWLSGGAANMPKYLALSPSEGTSAEPTPVMVTMLAADSALLPHREFMCRKASLGYNGEAFDLSRHNYLNEPCLQTTANCYVVDAPGKYRIPTAYGNAIVDGKPNTAAYTDKAGYRHSNGQNFMDYRGAAISAPMIQNNGIHLSRATLVWEDAQDLIDPASIQLVDGGDAIEFEILPEHIDQGNAVIAAMDGNNVVWSWHIWVTDEKASMANPIQDQNKYGEPVDFMPLTLGWCSNAKAWGAIGSDLAVRITMPAHLNSRASFRIHQLTTPAQDEMDNEKGNATYYNWGRKDPFPGAISTFMPIGTDDDGMTKPKPFFQSGADAASLGLHAELHVTYGTNWMSLLAQGALVGLDGFMTGMSIGNMIKFLKNAANPALAKETLNGYDIKIEKNAFSEGQAKDFYKPGYESYTQNEMAEMVGKGEITNPDYTRFAGKYAKGSSYSVYQSKDLGVGTMFYDENGVPIKFMQIIRKKAKTRLGDWVFKIFHVGSQRPVVSLATIGAYSTGIMASVSLATKSAFDLGSVMANTSVLKGGTEWCREMQNHGMPINYGILHPNILLRDPIAWVNHDGFGNLWNANQIDYDEKDRAVVKSIYDPCPAGYCVPSARDMSSLTDETTDLSLRGTGKETDQGQKVVFPALGYRNFWSGAEPGAAATNNINDQIMFNGAQGMYWTSSPAINQNEDGEKGAYAVNFRSDNSYDYYGESIGYKYTPRVVNDLKLQTSYALPIRPVRER